jgi:hypothetical protein
VGVVVGEGVQDRTALFCDGEEDAAAVERVFAAGEEAFGDGAVGELDYGVVAEAEALGGVGDGEDCVCGGAGDLQEELVLLGMQIDLLGGLLAEVEEGSELVAKVSESVQEGGLIVRCVRHYLYRITI